MIIFLYGEDSYQSLEKLKQLRGRFQREVDPTGTSITTLEGREVDLAHLRKVVLAPALFVKSRFVIIKNFLQTKPNEELQNNLVTLLQEYGQSDTSNVIVFWEDKGAKEYDKKNAVLFQYLIKQKFSQECKTPTTQQMREFVLKRVQAGGTTIERDALARLLQLVNTNTWQVAQEVDKLVAYATGRSIILADVELHVSHTEDADVYALLDLCVAGKRDQALVLLDRIIKNQDSVYSVLNTLKWHTNTVSLIASAAASGIQSDAAIAKETGLHAFVVKKNKTYAQQLSATKLSELYKYGLELELSLRKQVAPPKVLLSQFISICST